MREFRVGDKVYNTHFGSGVITHIEFRVGDKVISKAYGEGEVLSINYTGRESTHPILVSFPNYKRGLETTFTKEGMYEKSKDENYDIQHLKSTNEKNEMKYTTQAEVFEQFARVAKLIEGTDLELVDVFKFYGEKPNFEYANSDRMLSTPERYSFALALVEGKPVFTGDKLWSNFSNREVIIGGTTVYKDNLYLTHMNNAGEEGDTCLDKLTWKQPKKTFLLNGIEYNDLEEIIVNGHTFIRK